MTVQKNTHTKCYLFGIRGLGDIYNFESMYVFLCVCLLHGALHSWLILSGQFVLQARPDETRACWSQFSSIDQSIRRDSPPNITTPHRDLQSEREAMVSLRRVQEENSIHVRTAIAQPLSKTASSDYYQMCIWPCIIHAPLITAGLCKIYLLQLLVD